MARRDEDKHDALPSNNDAVFEAAKDLRANLKHRFRGMFSGKYLIVGGNEYIASKKANTYFEHLDVMQKAEDQQAVAPASAKPNNALNRREHRIHTQVTID